MTSSIELSSDFSLVLSWSSAFLISLLHGLAYFLVFYLLLRKDMLLLKQILFYCSVPFFFGLGLFELRHTFHHVGSRVNKFMIERGTTVADWSDRTLRGGGRTVGEKIQAMFEKIRDACIAFEKKCSEFQRSCQQFRDSCAEFRDNQVRAREEQKKNFRSFIRRTVGDAPANFLDMVQELFGGVRKALSGLQRRLSSTRTGIESFLENYIYTQEFSVVDGRLEAATDIIFSSGELLLLDGGRGLLLAGDENALSSGSLDRFRTVAGQEINGVKMKEPRGLDVDSLGNIYIADTGNDRVIILNREGNFKGEISLIQDRGRLFKPEDVAVGPDGRIAIANGDNSIVLLNHRFELVKRIGHEGTLAGEFRGPLRVAMSSDGILVAEKGNSRIQFFDENGNFLRVMLKQSFLRHILSPTAIYRHPNGSIFVGDASDYPLFVLSEKGSPYFAVSNFLKKEGLGRFFIFSPVGTIVGRFSRPRGSGKGPWHFEEIKGIAFSEKGEMAILDSGRKILTVFRRADSRKAPGPVEVCRG